MNLCVCGTNEVCSGNAPAAWTGVHGTLDGLIFTQLIQGLPVRVLHSVAQPFRPLDSQRTVIIARVLTAVKQRPSLVASARYIVSIG